MRITEADIAHVASLAAVELSAEEKRELAEQLSRVLDYFEKLKELDLADVEPTHQILTIGKHNVRDDRVSPRTGSSEAAKTAQFFKVPRVITDR